MNEDKIRESFDEIKADDALKQKTLQAVYAKTSVKKHSPMKLILTAAVLVLTAAAGILSYTTPVYAISIDEDVSMELQVNMYDRVVAVENYGADVSSSITNMNYVDAVKQLLDDSVQIFGYQDEGIHITVAGGSQAACDKIISSLECWSSQCNMKFLYESADSDALKQAQAYGISLGKYKAYLTLKEAGSAITIEEIQNMTMPEIRQLIKQGKGMNGKGMMQCN